MEYQCSRERFLKDIKDHQMTIIKEDGVYRHIRFSRPQSFAYRFDLITWPGYLTICGDMGCWTFSRTEDMFNFFTMRENDFNHKHIINPCYWEEKIQAFSRFGDEGKAKVFDLDTFKQECYSRIKEYFEEETELAEECIKEFNNDVLFWADDYHPQILYQKVYDFEFNDYKDIFCDCYPDGMIYGFYYIWILYAIVWGIRQYKSAQTK